jgi:hypothetical protein
MREESWVFLLQSKKIFKKFGAGVIGVRMQFKKYNIQETNIGGKIKRKELHKKDKRE